MIVQDQGLPEPTSSLSNFVPPKTIELANTEVEKVKNNGPRDTRSVPYLILTPVQIWVKDLQSMASCYKFVVCRKHSLCFTEYVF